MSSEISKHFLIDREFVKCIANGQADWAKTLYRLKVKQSLQLDHSETMFWNNLVYQHSFNILFRITVFDTGIPAEETDQVYKENLALLASKDGTYDMAKVMEQIIDNYCNLVNQHKGKNYSDLVMQAYNIINGDVSADLSLQSIADQLGVSSSHLSRQFHKEVGCPFNQYVRSIRIEKAKVLIKKSSYSISEIAEYCGYTDPSYFRNVFKTVTGITPSTYKNSEDIPLKHQTDHGYTPMYIY